jgi:cytochrome c oxidase subunit 3
MAAKAALEELEVIDAGAGGPGGRAGEPGGEGGGPSAALPLRPPHIYVTGIWLALASILMFFMGLTSSFIVRKGLSTDWASFPLPQILYWNTALLLVSSGTLETARRALARGLRAAFHRWWALTTALGFLFLAGQVVAWQELRAAGVYLATNPSSSFFYLLTGAHGLHLLGGLVAFLYVGVRSRRAAPWRVERAATTATSIYWHFLGGLWVFLFLLLLVGR